MTRIRISFVAFVACFLSISAYSGVIPPGSHGLGKSLGDWQLAYWTSTLTGGSQMEGSVLLMPLPEGEFVPGGPGVGNLVGQLDVEMSVGTSFFLPMFVFIGESYVQAVPDDDPADFEFIFFDNPGACDFDLTDIQPQCALSVLITVDGEPVIDSGSMDITEFYSGPVFFEPPITDGYPQERGEDLDAEAAIWVEGFGFAHGPLTPGEHELRLQIYTGLGFGFDNTWNLTVTLPNIPHGW